MHATHPRTQLDLDPREMPAWLRNKVETKHGEWRLKSRVLGFVAVAREPAGPGGGGRHWEWSSPSGDGGAVSVTHCSELCTRSQPPPLTERSWVGRGGSVRANDLLNRIEGVQQSWGQGGTRERQKEFCS